jgi:hypothetical protein
MRSHTGVPKAVVSCQVGREILGNTCCIYSLAGNVS